MKTYLVTTGLFFGLMAVVHVWRGIAEWPHDGLHADFAMGMAALILIPAALSGWAWSLLRKTSAGPSKIGQ
jgi:hypothetical protein